MGAITANANNFLLNTDYPLDNIVFITSGALTVPNGTSDFLPGVVIPHTLPFTPLPLMFWSNTSDFAVTNQTMDAAYASTAFSTGAGQDYRIEPTATGFNILRYNFSGSSQTVYYRIFAFAPSTVSDSTAITIARTASQGSNFILNTDNNYLKLYTKGRLVGAGSYNHGLGYQPRVLVWADGVPLVAANVVVGSPGSGGINVTDTAIEWDGVGYSTVEYRIYTEN